MGFRQVLVCDPLSLTPTQCGAKARHCWTGAWRLGELLLISGAENPEKSEENILRKIRRGPTMPRPLKQHA